MEKNKKNIFPKNFFKTSRPTVDNKETFTDVVPIKWNKDIIKGKRKTIVYSAKEKNM